MTIDQVVVATTTKDTTKIVSKVLGSVQKAPPVQTFWFMSLYDFFEEHSGGYSNRKNYILEQLVVYHLRDKSMDPLD